jgi:hypothetical protein
MFIYCANDLFEAEDCGTKMENGVMNGCFYLCVAKFLQAERMPGCKASALSEMSPTPIEGDMVQREQIQELAELLKIEIRVHVIILEENYYVVKANEIFGKSETVINLALYQFHYLLMKLIADFPVQPSLIELPTVQSSVDTFPEQTALIDLPDQIVQFNNQIVRFDDSTMPAIHIPTRLSEWEQLRARFPQTHTIIIRRHSSLYDDFMKP